jgi:uncharacterized peroxidase-related enzyme
MSSSTYFSVNRGAVSLGKYADELLRGESELTVGEREMLAAYVSGLNSCNFCHGNHKMIAEIHGVDPNLFESLIDSPGDSGIDEKWLPLLTYVRKLTESPSSVTDLDARVVFDAGFSEDALFDAISVCALFNFMNRMVEGCGVLFNDVDLLATKKLHEKGEKSATPYQDFVQVSTSSSKK